MKKYFIASVEESIEVVALEANSVEAIIDKTKRCGININWVIKEVKEETYNEWKGIKVKIS